MMVFKLSFITHTQIHPLTDFVILQIEVAVFHEHCVCGCVGGCGEVLLNLGENGLRERKPNPL